MDEDNSSGWQLTESDPGVFTALLHTLGVKRDGLALQVDDLYSLDAEALADLHPVHAFVFLFKWVPTPGGDDPGSSGTGGESCVSSYLPGCSCEGAARNVRRGFWRFLCAPSRQ